SAAATYASPRGRHGVSDVRLPGLYTPGGWTSWILRARRSAGVDRSAASSGPPRRRVTSPSSIIALETAVAMIWARVTHSPKDCQCLAARVHLPLWPKMTNMGAMRKPAARPAPATPRPDPLAELRDRRGQPPAAFTATAAQERLRWPPRASVADVAPAPCIYVLAGTNGAGKSSLAGATFLSAGTEYFNPDQAARLIRDRNPGLGPTEANSAAWHQGRRLLERAI